jgi:colanic acid/amylovoran biosynthesis glycosyltransferase
MKRPAVAQVLDRWLGLTETFIHAYLAGFQRVRSVIIAGRFENAGDFPLPDDATRHLRFARRGSPAWLSAAVRRRLRGGEPRLESILAREEARALHAHYGPVACSLLEVRRRTRLPLVASFYGYDASMHSVIREFGESYRRLFDLGNAFLAEGPAMGRRLEALGCPRSKIHIQPLAIEPARYRFRAREDDGRAPIVALMCGRMVPKKGYPDALRAFARAREAVPRLALRLVGDGPDRPALEALTRELGIAAHVTFAGAMPRAQFLAELDAAHIYMQPSRTAPDGDAEGGAPTALLEAQACGLPIVTTRHDDIPFVVREKDSALLSDEGDDTALAEHLVSLARSPAWWGPMGRMGRLHVEERHDVRALATQMEILYATVAETSSR